MADVRPDAKDTGRNHGSRMSNERGRAPILYCQAVLIRNRASMIWSHSVLVRLKAHPPSHAPAAAPGRYQRATRQSMKRHSRIMRAGLASTLVIVTTGATAWPRRMTATAATIRTLPPPAASVLITQLT